MNKLPTVSIREWYEALIEDCNAIITEAVFNSRWSLIEGYHQLGTRLLEENENFERNKIYGEEIVQQVAKSLGKSKRTVYNAIQFARMYPKIDELPDGKNITWARICNTHLRKKKVKKKCNHPIGQRSYFYQCKGCNKWVKEEKVV